MEEFRACKNDVFVSGFACDATSETLTLVLVGTEAVRSAWHVLVSSHRFSWFRGNAWSKVDFCRPNIAMTSSESAATLWSACYKSAAVEDYAAFERTGIETARLAFLHNDIDGLSAGWNAVAMRRQQLITEMPTGQKPPVVTIIHCGNHVEHLLGNHVYDNIGLDADLDIDTVMSTLQTFHVVINHHNG